MMSIILKIAILLFCFTINIGWAFADFDVSLAVTTAPQLDGSTLYRYTITNTMNSTLNVQSLDLIISSDADIKNVSSPLNWTVLYSPGDTDILWSAGPDIDAELPPGSSAIFSFTSFLPPSLQNYDIFGIDYDGVNYDDSVGTIASPSASSIPEPTSMIPLGIGMTTLASYSLYRGKRQR